MAVQDALWVNIGCVAIIATANSTKERLKMKGTAVAQVFHDRTRAVDWLKSLGEEES